MLYFLSSFLMLHILNYIFFRGKGVSHFWGGALNFQKPEGNLDQNTYFFEHLFLDVFTKTCTLSKCKLKLDLSRTDNIGTYMYQTSGWCFSHALIGYSNSG